MCLSRDALKGTTRGKETVSIFWKKLSFQGATKVAPQIKTPQLTFQNPSVHSVFMQLFLCVHLYTRRK